MSRPDGWTPPKLKPLVFNWRAPFHEECLNVYPSQWGLFVWVTNADGEAARMHLDNDLVPGLRDALSAYLEAEG